MRARSISLILTSVVFVGVGVWLGWVVLIAIALSVASLVGVCFVLRAPSSGQWQDVDSPIRVTRGESAELTIAVSMSPGSTRWVSAADRQRTDRVFLGSSSESVLTWTIDTSRRGRFDVGPTLLEIADPFGFYSRTLAERKQTSVLVVPRVHAIPRDQVMVSAVAESGRERAGSESFESVREYVVGDPQKLVHWKASARAGKLMVRRMVDTTLPWLLVVLDVNAKAYDRSGSMFDDFNPESFEQSVETAASWAWHGCGSQQRVLLTTTATVGFGSDAAVEVTIRNRESALDWLAVVGPHTSEVCGAERVTALIRRHAVSRTVVITGQHHGIASPWLTQLHRRTSATTLVGHT